MTAQPTRDQLEAELDYWMTRAYEAEKRAWQAEARVKHLEDTARVLVKETLNAEADRDWNLRSSRIAKKERIEANARAERAEAQIKAVQHLIDQADEMGEWAIACTRLQWAIDGSAPQPGA